MIPLVGDKALDEAGEKHLEEGFVWGFIIVVTEGVLGESLAKEERVEVVEEGGFFRLW